MKNIKLMLAAVGIALLSTSCLVDDEDKTLDDMSSTPYAIGFVSTNPTISYFEDIGLVDGKIAVDIIGGQDGGGAKSNITVQYEVNQELSTAQEGVEYSFAGTKGTTIIPEGERFGIINLDVNTGSFNPDVSTKLVLDITSVSGDSVIITEQSQVTLNFVGCLADLADYTYSVNVVRASDGATVNNTEGILERGVNSYRTETSGNYPAGQFTGAGAPYDGFNFSVICGDITIPEQNLGGFYSNQVFGSGEVDVQTGNITMSYTITFGTGDQIFNATYIRQ